MVTLGLSRVDGSLKPIGAKALFVPLAQKTNPIR